MNRYTDLMPLRPMLVGAEFDVISNEHQGWVERPFLEDEVLFALNSMEDDKAPRPDGFPTKFLKICWDVMGKEVMVAFEAFHSCDQWCRSLSATFISFIPKKKALVEIKDYRPISLVGCLYKGLAKTLAIRLKATLGAIIFYSQNTFISGRNLANCFLIANECFNAAIKTGRP